MIPVAVFGACFLGIFGAYWFFVLRPEQAELGVVRRRLTPKQAVKASFQRELVKQQQALSSVAVFDKLLRKSEKRTAWIKALIEQSGVKINVGADSHHSVNELADIVVRAMDRPAKIRRVEARNEVKVAYSDHTRFKQVFQTLVQTPLEEGVRRMAAWAKTAPIRKTADFSNIEIPRNLPPVWTAAKRS